jgi:SAM-dependent methyltransferase
LKTASPHRTVFFPRVRRNAVAKEGGQGTGHFMEAVSFDPIWEEKYSAGHQQRAPWDETVSFVFRNMPKQKARNEITILEVGCGTASNLWFFSLEGFDVAGIDASSSAITKAQARFKKDNLKGDLRVGDFTQLPFQDHSFDLVIDRAALTHSGTSTIKSAVREIHRVLKKDGKFFFTPFADSHGSNSAGQRGGDGLTIDIQASTLTGAGQVCFVSRTEIDEFLPRERWNVISLEFVEVRYMLGPFSGCHDTHWRVTAAKR